MKIVKCYLSFVVLALISRRPLIFAKSVDTKTFYTFKSLGSQVKALLAVLWDQRLAGAGGAAEQQLLRRVQWGRQGRKT